MSDPSTPRTARTRPEPGAHRRPFRGGRWAAAVALTRAVLIAAGLVTAYYLLPLDEHGTAASSALLVCGLVGMLLVFGWEVWAITRSPHPRLKAVEALAATVALFLVLFAGAYYLLDRSTPGSFSESLTRTDALYFALTTFSTVGFGDIAARSQAGRVLTMAQMAGGLLLVGIAARVLASAVQAGLRRQRRGPTAEPRSGTDAGTRDGEAG
ncbi:potassium channel family protein [Streptomyces turgidiscabies]|uniref:Ion channel n=1 Tax=Streptomyces turgidiscabies (strain Car8) TaxID=698760 RepID=L7EZ74_STRT8|nr:MULTISPECIES: potassium channel family protein [Streptomyces]ELP63640.1 Ion channel [Streptomyces turgidiscabies Car8]MDX3499951.1 potassium channel family protein [Streptomyces turgidiscabies]GAQ76990.1 PH-gated potassium channel KcsA [Streptomyces turgidiscabies]